MAEVESETLGFRLARFLKERKWSQSELARRSGVDRSQLSRLIAGKRSPKPDELAWIAGALDMDVEKLLAGAAVDARIQTTAETLIARGKRLLETQRELELAVARTQQLEQDRERECEAWNQERRQLLEEVLTIRQGAAGLRDQLGSTQARLRGAVSENQKLRNYAKRLETAKAEQASNTALAALLGGLGGALLVSSS